MRPLVLAALTSANVLLFFAPFLTSGSAAQPGGGVPPSQNSDANSIPGQQLPAAAPYAAVRDLDSASDAGVPLINPASNPQFSEKLRELISNGLPRYIDRREEQTSIATFYEQRDYQPLWTLNGAATPRAQSVIDHLKNAAHAGLDPIDYPTPNLAGMLSADAAAANELQLTHSVLTYARHANSGRVSYTRVSGAILYPSHAPDPAHVLSQLASSENIDATLNSFEPQHPGYKALRAQLEKLLAADGASDDRPPSSDDLQQSNRGHKALKRTTNSSRINIIIANMERWRWLPRDLGAAYVMVNIPDYTLQLVNNGKTRWGTKIVVGKPGDMATPLLSETMKYLTINPTWNVPPSIIRNEYLPALQRDPDALERIGLKVGRNHDGSIRVYQPPGARNALGRIRFNFPNPFLVYQHDTPNKNLFAQSHRALSHGCMRVQNPEQYAEELLAVSQPKEAMTVDRIRDLYGDEERTIRLEHPIPVHVTYQTAYVDEKGRLATRDDIYGLDAAILKLLHGPDRTVAERPIPRNYESSSKPVMARLPSLSRVAEHNGYDERYDERSDGRKHSSWSYVDNPYYNRSVGTW